ncbi:hypothetical protein EJ04DRAFT_556458 [Polyplosphaeria fusca]|uniref:Uncharacterized protein n=1 Tax=Polyplosphaeria fusca TaxID=682080 RepID=A0A9P4UY62_9PLEO|nr:hypothetical protein EJ04DRAFT_556458 [Polyplosphaeria fusca]
MAARLAIPNSRKAMECSLAHTTNNMRHGFVFSRAPPSSLDRPLIRARCPSASAPARHTSNSRLHITSHITRRGAHCTPSANTNPTPPQRALASTHPQQRASDRLNMPCHVHSQFSPQDSGRLIPWALLRKCSGPSGRRSTSFWPLVGPAFPRKPRRRLKQGRPQHHDAVSRIAARHVTVSRRHASPLRRDRSVEAVTHNDCRWQL